MVDRVWRRWAQIQGRAPEPFIAVAHGRRISETLRLVAPDLDWRRETASLDRMEQTETDGLVATPAAAQLLDGLPASAWAVVTSGSRPVARLRLDATRLPTPRILVTGEDVERGKPDPEGYRLAARRLDLSPKSCVVIEDAPPGIQAGKAAGMRVIAVLTTHAPERLAEADIQLPNLTALRIRPIDGELHLDFDPVAGPQDTRHTPTP